MHLYGISIAVAQTSVRFGSKKQLLHGLSDLDQIWHAVSCPQKRNIRRGPKEIGPETAEIETNIHSQMH